jgi:dolichol kinase
MFRLKNPVFNERITRVFGPLLRHHEVNRMSTVPYFLAATFFAIAVFPKPVATLSLLYLAWGDPAASFFGVLFKGRSIKISSNKSLHGAVAAFSVCALITLAYLKSGGMDGLNVIRLTLLGGFAGALAESLPLEIDDNFAIPVISGFIIWAGFLMVQFF